MAFEFIIINLQDDKELESTILSLQQDYPAYFREPKRLINIIRMFTCESITMIIETEYIDKQYRDSYYSFFSQKYRSFERNCLRVAFLEGEITPTLFCSDQINQDHLIGTIVLRPLAVGNIGYTLLKPEKLGIKGFFRTCIFRVMVYGKKFSIRAFPFMSQDDQTMTCAETALYNLILYYATKYSTYRALLPNEIIHLIERESPTRVLPSTGVGILNIAKVLMDAHLSPKLYCYADYKDNQPNQNCSFQEILYVYIESGIPLILLLPGHAVSCIGHTRFRYLNGDEYVKEKKQIFSLSTASIYDEYAVMDDNAVPYQLTTLDDLIYKYCSKDRSIKLCKSDLESVKNNENGIELIVPVYKRICMDASTAITLFKVHFLDNPDFIKFIRKVYNEISTDSDDWGKSKENPIVWRMYLTAAKSYKSFKAETIQDEVLNHFYRGWNLPHFVWVFELGTIDSYNRKKARAEIVLDATSHADDVNMGILSVGFHNHLIVTSYERSMKIYSVEESRGEDGELVACMKKVATEKDVGDDSFDNKITDTPAKKFLTKLFQVLYNKCDFPHWEEYMGFANSNLRFNGDFASSIFEENV